jgi:hypothetical protein
VINRAQKGVVGINNSSLLTPDSPLIMSMAILRLIRVVLAGDGGVQTDPKFVGGNPFDYNLAPDSTLRLQDRFGSEMGRYGNSRL